jgi:uncharacterized damage-inducible protein DinB
MEVNDIADLIERVMTGDPWHGPNVERVLDGVTHDQAARRPPGGAHSIWELVLHMTGWAREVTARLGGRAAQDPEVGDWPEVTDTTADRWRADQAALFAAHRELIDAVQRMDTDALTRPVIDFRNSSLGTGMSHYLTLHGIVHHTVYHSGQIAMLKRMWPG